VKCELEQLQSALIAAAQADDAAPMAEWLLAHARRTEQESPQDAVQTDDWKQAQANARLPP
jgi:hypothetical protein